MVEFHREHAFAAGQRLESRLVIAQFGERYPGGNLYPVARHRIAAGNAPTDARQMARDVADRCARRSHLDPDDGLQHDRTRLGDGIDEGALAGGDKGDLLGIHRMVLAVVDDHFHVLHRIPRDGAFLENLLDALLHRRYELAGYRPTNHLVGKFVAAAPRQRFDFQKDFAELSGATRLLLVAVVPLGRAQHRLPVGDLRRPGGDVDAEFVLHALHNDPQVQFAHAPQDRFVGLGVEFDLQARVFGGHLVQRVGEFLFLPALGQLQGDAVHGRRDSHRTHSHFIVVMTGMQDVVEADVLDLGDGADVARHGRRHFLELLALDAVDMRQLHALALVADINQPPGPDFALVHAERGQPAHVRVHVDLEHVPKEVAVRARRIDLVRCRGLPFTGEELGGVALERARHEL